MNKYNEQKQSIINFFSKFIFKLFINFILNRFILKVKYSFKHLMNINTNSRSGRVLFGLGRMILLQKGTLTLPSPPLIYLYYLILIVFICLLEFNFDTKTLVCNNI